MSSFEEFIESDIFLIIICISLIVLIVIFCYILLSGKKSKRRKKHINQIDSNKEFRMFNENEELIRTNNVIPVPALNSERTDEITSNEIQLIKDYSKTNNNEPIYNIETSFVNTESNDNKVITKVIDTTPEEKIVGVPINEHKIEEKKEDVPKVEGLNDFPDFTGLNGKDSDQVDIEDLDSGKNIEDDIIETANKYIASIMSK